MTQEKTVSENKISEGIYLYKNALSEKLCDDIWDFYYSHIGLTESGRTSGGYYPQTKKTLDFSSEISAKLSPADNQKYQDLDLQIYKALRATTEMYAQTYDSLQKAPLMDTGYLWQMYTKGDGYYREHIDGDQWSKHVSDRVLAVVIYINTVDEGGETYFRLQNISVKPEKGTVCLFPAHWQYPHQAQVPISNDKLIISSFVISSVR